MLRAGIAPTVLAAAVATLFTTFNAAPAQTGGVAPAVYHQQPRGPVFRAGGDMVDAYGNPAVVPAQYQACGPCGPGGYAGGAGYHEQADLFGGAGLVTEQSGPHYFDISAEALYWKRGDLGSATVPITSLGFAVSPSLSNIVQSTDSLDPDFEPGFRIFGRYDIGPLSVIEAGYTGLLNQTQNSSVAATTTDATGLLGNLFSPFTTFGVSFLDDGLGAPNPFAAGFDPADLEDFEETDRATAHALSFDSNLQSAEVNYRRYWVGYSPRLSGTLLIGFRYTRLDEALSFNSTGADFDPGTAAPGPVPTAASSAAFTVATANDLTGFQIGADSSYAVRQGIRFNLEGKAGLFNNELDVRSTFATADGSPAFSEVFSEQQVAFITEGRATLIMDVLPSLSIKAGYEVLFLNSIATAVDNLNFGGIVENAAVPPRVPFLDDQGDAVYHGAHLGLEYVW